MKLSEKERLARMRRVWVAEGPSNFEVASARTRILQQGSQRRSRLRRADGPLQAHGLLGDLALGLALAGAFVLAVRSWFHESALEQQLAMAPTDEWVAGAERGNASNAAPADALLRAAGSEASALSRREADDGARPADRASAENGEGSEQVARLAGVSPRIERAGVVTSAAPGVTYEVAAGERVTVVLGAERTVVEGPRLIEFTFEADRASGFKMHLSTPAPSSRPSKSRSKGAAVAPDETHVGAWTRAVEALRLGDRLRAEKALLELSEGPASESADSAALALAQLWLARGETSRAMPVLQRLSASSHSDVVRRRAAELLAQ